MSMMRFNFRSQVLGYFLDVSIVYPTDDLSYFDPKTSTMQEQGTLRAEGKEILHPGMKFQTVYLIHGGGDDDSLTYRYTNAERYAQKNRVMLVTPDIANSFGVDTCYDRRYQTFLAEELPVVIQSLFASSPRREDNFLIGYAMGGNVALGTALMHQDTFAYCVDISGGIGMTLSTQTLMDELVSDHFRERFPIYLSTFGKREAIPDSRFDLYAQAKARLESGRETTKFFLSCGSEEFIRARVDEDARLLKELGYDITYEIAEGYDHDFEMWDRTIRKALDEILPLKRRAVEG